MTYQECIDYILSIPLFAAKLGTEYLNQILELMDHPERSYPVIHVAGTNGKGSTCSYLGSILKEKGFRVGIFTSPHLNRLNERIRVNNDIISDECLVEVFEEVMHYVELAGGMGIPHPSFFEFVFLMGALFFRRERVDYAIFETGMGGRLDATNVVHPVLCIITSVGLDHMQYLGNTISEIAGEKAGIIKPGVPVVYFDRKDEATKIISNYSKKVGAFFHSVEKTQYKLLKIKKKSIDFSFDSVYYRYDSLKIRKTGLYQIENAILAVRAYELLSENHFVCNTALCADMNAIHTQDTMLATGLNLRKQNSEFFSGELSEISEASDELIEEFDCRHLHRDLRVIRSGLWNMTWSGRMEQLADHIYVDGAHNEEAIRAFVHTLEVLFPTEQKILLFAVSKDKDYKRMVEILGRISFEEIILVRYHGDRSAELGTVEEAFRQFSGSKITTFDDIEAGFDYAKAHVKDQYLFCVGSLYLVGDLLDLGV